MNERIEQLAEQAGLLHEHMTTGERTDYLNKFNALGKLIVKDCVNICNTTTDRGYLNGVIAGHKIKEHFGVEDAGS